MASLPEDPNYTKPKRIKLGSPEWSPSAQTDGPVSPSDVKRRRPKTPPQGNDVPSSLSVTLSPITDDVSDTTPTLFSPSQILPPSPSSDSTVGYEGDPEELTNDCSGDVNDNDDTSSTVSQGSDISILSGVSGQQWLPRNLCTKGWIEKQMCRGIRPRDIFSQMNCVFPEHISDFTLWKLLYTYLNEPLRRNQLEEYTSFDDAVNLIKNCKKILVLTGAGVSVSCGIPDFRSRNGVYARLAVDFPNLPNPQAMFDINYFHYDPRPFFKFAKEIYPGQFKPSPCHRFIKMLEKQKKLLRNYTQNIDTLEKVAGIENVVECHGSFSTATCTKCGHRVSCDAIREEVFQQKIPRCSVCASSIPNEEERGIMKPDIVFFGEGLPETFHEAMGKDKDECDLLIVIGSSLKVRPVALIPNSLPSNVPQILINRERLRALDFDIELLGDSDVVVDQLCYMLGEEWQEIRWRESPLEFIKCPIEEFNDIDDNSDCESLSRDENEDEKSIDQASEEEVSLVKCQRIGRRHIPGDEPSRTMSLDSSRDSGIGEGSNSSNDSPTPSVSEPPPPEALAGEEPPSATQGADSTSVTESFDTDSVVTEPPLKDLPEIKPFLSPQDNKFFRLKKRVYVFPGAELRL